MLHFSYGYLGIVSDVSTKYEAVIKVQDLYQKLTPVEVQSIAQSYQLLVEVTNYRSRLPTTGRS